MDLLRTYVTIIVATVGLTVAGLSHSDDKRLLLDNEPTVDLGGEVSRLQAQLLDQQKLINAIQNITTALQKDLANTTATLKQQEVAAKQKDQELQSVVASALKQQKDLENVTAALKQQEVAAKRKDQDLHRVVTSALKQQKDLENVTASLKQQEDVANQMKHEFQNNITELKQENEQLKTFQRGSGSVYVRWGRTVCPSTASIVYKGFTAGKHHSTNGSGSDNLCLPSDPTWSKFVDGIVYGDRAYIFGAEIDTFDSDHIFNYPVHNQDVPCIVCRSTKTSTVMIPARKSCYDGWTMEYHGYLMAGFYAFHAYNHVCVDENPEFLNHGGTDDNQHTLFLVEGRCGSLPCPPYVEGRELACVVCSK